MEYLLYLTSIQRHCRPLLHLVPQSSIEERNIRIWKWGHEIDAHHVSSSNIMRHWNWNSYKYVSLLPLRCSSTRSMFDNYSLDNRFRRCNHEPGLSLRPTNILRSSIRDPSQDLLKFDDVLRVFNSLMKIEPNSGELERANTRDYKPGRVYAHEQVVVADRNHISTKVSAHGVLRLVINYLWSWNLNKYRPRGWASYNSSHLRTEKR